MKRFRLSRPSPSLVVALIALTVACSGVALAAIPSSSGVISACYSKVNGTLRVVDAEAGKKCGAGDGTLSWNQQGPKGDRGLDGKGIETIWSTDSNAIDLQGTAPMSPALADEGNPFQPPHAYYAYLAGDVFVASCPNGYRVKATLTFGGVDSTLVFDDSQPTINSAEMPVVPIGSLLPTTAYSESMTFQNLAPGLCASPTMSGSLRVLGIR
ncbi:MAG: hypothetical protein QOI80_3440 [Solirubrobacteraceae bacterium]|nr:hypothetical protein [Solirubrobacteraceae bacterium]